MNKQEAIEKLQSEAVNHYSETSGWFKKIKLDIVTDIVNQINEPEKPVVPQFVADWYEDCKDDFEFDLYILCLDYNNCEVDEKLSEWFCDKHNKPLETLVNMHQFGYRVYKEKLYTAKLKSTGEYLHYDAETDKVHHFCAYGNTAKHSENCHFTKDTLIKYNAWGNNTYEVNEVKE